MRSQPPVALPSSSLADPDSLEQMIGDCRRMAEHWKTPATAARPVVPPAGLHGITVPPASAQAVRGMAEYGA